MTDVDGEADVKKSRSIPPSMDSLGTWLSILLGGAAAVFTFLGIKEGEVHAILRNEAGGPTVVALLVGGSLLLAAAGVFTEGFKIQIVLAVGLGSLALLPAVISILKWPIPSSSRTSHSMAIVAICVLVVIGASLVVLAYKNRSSTGGHYVPLQLVFVLLSILFLGQGMLVGLRLETRSQYDSTHPQLSVSVERADQLYKVVVAVKAAELRAEDKVGLRVNRFAGKDVAADCNAAADLKVSQRVIDPDEGRADYYYGCLERPCKILGEAQCELLAGIELKPNEVGRINSSYTILLSAIPSKVEFRAVPCLKQARQTGCFFMPERDTLVALQLP